ncbi:MAG: hypothetical protein ING77_09755 [Rhodocyclaceae bacterium]|nr:hypothetical protein [Rhodocyclaceae bacterium]
MGDDYSTDMDATFLVVQPFLLNGNHPDHLDPLDYFEHWNADTLKQQGFGLIDQPLARTLQQAHDQQQNLRAIPVPFPGGTQIVLTLKGARRSGAALPDWHDDRTIGGSTASGTPVSAFDQLGGDAALGWPGFAILSQAVPLVVEFDDLDRRANDGPQKRAVESALLTLFSQMVELWSAAGPSLQANDPRVEIWIQLVQPQYQAHPLSDQAWWHLHLREAHGGGTWISWAYRRLIDAVAQGPLKDEPPVSVPRFPWNATLLEHNPQLFLDTNILAGRSYLDALWENVREIGRREPAKLAPTLERLFGFGERLAWPRARVNAVASNAKRFMTLRPQLDRSSLPPDQPLPAWLDPTAWMVTNMVSLLGQVFRVSPFDPQDPPTNLNVAEFSIAGHQLPVGAGLAQALNSYFEAIARDAATGVMPRVELKLSGEHGAQTEAPTFPDRFVLFAAREAAPVALGPNAQPAARALAAIGEALLDVVDEAARFDNGGPKKLPSVAPARRGLLPNELAAPFPAGARTRQRRIAEIEPMSLTGIDDSGGPKAYALRFPEPLHQAEATVGKWLGEIAGGAVRETFLWIPKVDAAQVPQPMAEVLLTSANVRVDIDGTILILDPTAAAAGSLGDQLSHRPELPGGSKDPRVVIVFATDGVTEPFDLIDGLPQTWSIILAKAAASRLGLTSDRLALTIAAHWTPGYDPDKGPANGAATPLIDQVANTNKLRLTFGGPNGFSRPLTLPDALLPLPEFDTNAVAVEPNEKQQNRPWHRRGEVKINGPQAYYWLGEYFDQANGSDSGLEATRFATWVHAGAPFSLEGYFEHQYGHRVGIQPLALEVRRGVDVVNPAHVHFGAAPANIGGKGQRLALLAAREVQVSATETRLQIGFLRDAARHALERYQASRPTEDSAADLRTLYRSLADLRDAILARNAFLEVEQWGFDNSYAIGAGNGATLAQGLTFLDNTMIWLELPAPGSSLARAFAALDRDLATFVAELDAILSASNDIWWAQLVEASISDAARRASVLRTGLLIARPDGVKATLDWAKGAFIPVAESGPAAGIVLADATQTELARYLTRSRFTAAIDYVFVPASEAKAPVLGTAAATLLVPEAPTQQVERVVDLFYMPHAFVLPFAHPGLGDRQSSFDFTGFLLMLIEDVLNGRSIADRIAFPPIGADAAEKLRHRLRALLTESGGIADQLMRKFQRVDIPEPTPPADRRRALHWHAGQLLDTLETLEIAGVPSPERPSSAIRQMLLDRPSLFASARAISIAPFNTHVERPGSDPAAAFNHDSFSPELLALDLTKTLVGDDGSETTDVTRFDLAALRGGNVGASKLAYLIDVLPDKVYDDTVVIGQNRYRGIDPDAEDQWGLPRSINDVDTLASSIGSGATVRRGEDAIDPPKQGEPNGIAANVVHVFPSWRVSERDPKGVSRRHAYYLLPERRIPPLARAIPIRRLDGADATQSPIVLSLPAAPPLPRVKLREAWTPAYDNITASLNAFQVITQGDERPRVYRRIRAAQNPHDPATRALPIGKVGGADAVGWHLLTTVLAHFYFAIDLQKSDAKLVEQLDDDLYEIEIEMWRTSPPADPPQAPLEVDGTDKLLDAYRRSRALRSGSASQPIPQLNDEDELVALLSHWMIEPPGQGPYYGRRLLDPSPATQKSQGAPTLRRRFRIGRSAQAGAWQIKLVKSDVSDADDEIAGALGSLVGFEVLAQVAPGAAQGPRYDDKVGNSERSALLRLSVLDHPFHVTRARVRIVRNWIDIDGDDKPDINPAFVLASGYSEWSCEGRTPQRVDGKLLDQSKVPDAGRELRVVSTNIPPEARMREWLSKADAGGVFDAGDALPAVLDVPVFIDVDDGEKAKSLWESDWMRHDGFTVSAMINRTLTDIGPRYGLEASVYPIPTRETTTVRQVRNAVPAGNLDTLLNGLQPAEILTLDAWARLAWRDGEGHAVLEVDMPLVFKSR